MGLLREALRRLCQEIGWSYAVFWRAVRLGDRTHLVWEDGYCERLPGISGFESLNPVLKEQGPVQCSHDDCFAEVRCQAEDRVAFLVDKIMVSQVHVVGDGIVGQAASVGRHQWIVQDTLNNCGSIPEGIADMNSQFLAGIQTIAIIPVLPHGAVQLGSTQRVMENVGFVNLVVSLFAQLGCVPRALFSDVSQKALSWNSQSHSSVDIPIFDHHSTNVRNNLGRCLPVIASGCTPQPLKGPNSSTDIQPLGASFPQSNMKIPPITLEVSSIKQAVTARTMPLSNQIQPNINPVGLPSRNSRFLEGQLLFMSSVDSLKSANDAETAIDDDRTVQLKYHGCKNAGLPEDSDNSSLFVRSELFNEANVLGSVGPFPGSKNKGIRASCANSSVTGVPQMLNQTTHSNSSEGISEDCLPNQRLPIGPSSEYDLFDVLGLNYQRHHSCANLGDIVVGKDDANDYKLGPDISHLSAELDLCPIADSLNDEISCTGIFSVEDTDQLLDAVISKINSGSKQSSDDTVSCDKTSITNIYDSRHAGTPINDWVVSSEKMCAKNFASSSMFVKTEVAGSSCVGSACNFDSAGEDTWRGGTLKSQIPLWVESGQSMKCGSISTANSERADEPGKLNWKRPKPGASPRPRPKDRQMIQDRIKELREIIPNGAKCSIDSLLEKTIKHMLYLQSVTKHADKLKETGEPKIISKDRGLLLKDNFEGGATWAFEVGSQSMICPIVVEDLNPPRQLLVEMLCDERGFFLEIADFIRGLGLTILKGVMEARKKKVWARFAVEVLPSVVLTTTSLLANRDVTRMEIFLSLVRLLEPNAGSHIAPQNEDNINMPHNMWHQPSLAATGLSDRHQ